MSEGKIAVVTDSTAYFPDELLKKYEIHVIPLNVYWSGKSYSDNVDISPEEFYQRLQSDSELPTTSQPSAGEFQALFQKLSETYAGDVEIEPSTWGTYWPWYCRDWALLRLIVRFPVIKKAAPLAY